MNKKYWAGIIGTRTPQGELYVSSSKVISIFVAMVVAAAILGAVYLKAEISAIVGALCVVLLIYSQMNRSNSRGVMLEALGIKFKQDICPDDEKASTPKEE